MKFLQKLGKALMLPVAVLPICGILMGIGYRLCPATMQGGENLGHGKSDRSVPRKSRWCFDRQHGDPVCNRCRCRYVREK